LKSCSRAAGWDQRIPHSSARTGVGLPLITHWLSSPSERQRQGDNP
jgi:hypothetical protein